MYIVVKCINCEENHQVNDLNCKVRQAILRSKTSKANVLVNANSAVNLTDLLNVYKVNISSQMQTT